jgi:hypothetical protein
MRFGPMLVGVGLAASISVASAAPAVACCLVDVVIDGEGLDAPIELDTWDLMDLDVGLRDFGFFVEAPIGDELPRLLEAAPTSSLGPVFTVTWTSSGQTDIVQSLHPYASGGPLVHTGSGQMFSEADDAEVRGGWFRADPQLVTDLHTLGLPERDRLAGRDTNSDSGSGATSNSSGDRSRASSWWRPLGAILAVVLLAVAAVAVRVRRRQRVPPT